MTDYQKILNKIQRHAWQNQTLIPSQTLKGNMLSQRSLTQELSLLLDLASGTEL